MTISIPPLEMMRYLPIDDDGVGFSRLEMKVVGDGFFIPYNSELYELLNEMDVAHSINVQWLRLVGHVV